LAPLEGSLAFAEGVMPLSGFSRSNALSKQWISISSVTELEAVIEVVIVNFKLNSG